MHNQALEHHLCSPGLVTRQHNGRFSLQVIAFSWTAVANCMVLATFGDAVANFMESEVACTVAISWSLKSLQVQCSDAQFSARQAQLQVRHGEPEDIELMEAGVFFALCSVELFIDALYVSCCVLLVKSHNGWIRRKLRTTSESIS